MSAPKWTLGPWVWQANSRGELRLATPDRGNLTVMDFVRHGTQGAQPRFAVTGDDEPRGRRGGIMRKASDLLDWPYFDGYLGHPDALLIQSAPDLAKACEAAIEHMEWSTPQGKEAYDALQAALAKVRGEA